MRSETNAKQRDRCRAVLRTMDEVEREGDEVAEMIGRSPRFVDEWAARYRRGGLAALVPRKQPGRRPELTAEQEATLETRLDAGPRDADGVCTLRGKDVCRIIEKEFGVVHTLGGIYDVLRRLGYSSLTPRPRHRKNDPAAMQQFVADRAPLLAAPWRGGTPAAAPRRRHPGKRLRFFAQDGARVGQQGTLTRVWARTGSRPAAVRQTEYEWVYLWAAVEPATGASVAMITPTVDSALMNRFLAGLSATLAADEHAILALDNAGWHRSAGRVPPPWANGPAAIY